MQFQDMTELELDTHAAYAAEYFWWTCRKDVNNKVVLKSSLRDRLSNDQEADFAFGLFDLDGDGYVVEEEVHARIRNLYRCVPRDDCLNIPRLAYT
jgi:hypothetical protein